MTVIRRYPVIFLLLSALIIPAGGWSQEKAFNVVASIRPVHSILAALMQGGEAPELLVSGAELPFEHKLTAMQRQQIEAADLVVWTGPELEPFMQEVITGLKGKTRVVELLDLSAMKILPQRRNSNLRDPFFWMDSRNILILADQMARTLIEADPVRSHLYLYNRRELHRKLSELDRRYEFGYRGLSQGVALLLYDSLQYFAQAYAMRLGEVLSPLPAEPVATETLLKVRNHIRNGEFVCVLTETGMPNEYLSLLTDGLSVRIGELDSFGQRFQPGSDLYAQLMEYNTGVIQDCLGQEGAAKSAYPDTGEPLPGEALGGRFILTDHNGREVTEDDLLGSYHLLFFGYTHCPDVCPTSLQVLARALKNLGDDAKRFVPWFITVDPERDTVETLREYLGYFNENMIGLTGSSEMLERVTRQYRVKYEKVQGEAGDPSLYTMDHTASLFLIGPDGRFITKFANGITHQALSERLRAYR
ncbi:MAG: SCO family protein [Gammaproteobacteria bacterium]|nr:SCO family protein [Gammaproteobacteria bacterium]